MSRRRAAWALTAAAAVALCAALAGCGSGGDGDGDGGARGAGGDGADRLVTDAPTTATEAAPQAKLAVSPTTVATSAPSSTAAAPSTTALPPPSATSSEPPTSGAGAADDGDEPDDGAADGGATDGGGAAATTGASGAPGGGTAEPAPAVPPTSEAPPPPAPPPPPPATIPPPPEPYVFEVLPISAELALRMTPTSWRPGCPVGLEDLRYLRLSYWGMDSASHIGELVVHRDAAAEVGAIFAELYANRFPITQMVLVDDFGGSDDASVAADNTSAFNCRPVTGSTNRWSQHAYGTAIDINPIENPYIGGSGTIAHPASEPYRDRSTYRLGMFVEGHVGVAAFDRFGWDWGGRWSSPIDYQHFSRTGG